MKFYIKKVSLALLVFSLILISLFSVQKDNFSKNVEINPNIHAIGPTKIDDDDEFIIWLTFYGFSGNGTKDDPYIIENEVFNGNSEVCLHIWETTLHFLIRNCTFINSGGKDAISLHETQNGKFINNTFSDDHYAGIDGSKCDNLIISENIASNSEAFGVDISFSTNVTLSDNFFLNNGIDGLRIGYCTNVLCMNNTANNNIEGISIQRSNNTRIIQNTMNNNTNDGIDISECFQIEILENLINENEIGINSGTSDNNTISENIINNNELYGIFLFKSNYNLIKDNTLLGNGHCFRENECEGNIFEDNTCKKDSTTTISGYYTLIIIGIIFLANIIVFKKKYKHRN